MLLLDERGYVLDDGLHLPRSRDALHAEPDQRRLDLRRAVDPRLGRVAGFDVRIMNQTMSLGAINVTGPGAELLARAGVASLPGFARHGGRVAGIDCHIFALSFTGELSYELHHAAGDSVRSVAPSARAGRGSRVRPTARRRCSTAAREGHIIVGQDTDYDSTPRRIHHEWAARLDKEEYIGLPAVRRTNKIDLDKQLVGLEMELPAPIEGEVIWNGEEHAGYVTSSCESPQLGKAVMLGWLDLVDGELPEEVTVDGRTARRVPTPFYDPEGLRARAVVPDQGSADRAPSRHQGQGDRGDEEPPDDRPERSDRKGQREEVSTQIPRLRLASLTSARDDQGESPSAPACFPRLAATHIVATAAALDEIESSLGVLVLRIAADEALVMADVSTESVPDPDAIVEPESGFSGAWIAAEEAVEILACTCAWELPAERPAFAQGAVADVPVKLYFENDRVLFLAQTPYAAELVKRLSMGGQRL